MLIGFDSRFVMSCFEGEFMFFVNNDVILLGEIF